MYILAFLAVSYKQGPNFQTRGLGNKTFLLHKLVSFIKRIFLYLLVGNTLDWLLSNFELHLIFQYSSRFIVYSRLIFRIFVIPLRNLQPMSLVYLKAASLFYLQP